MPRAGIPTRPIIRLNCRRPPFRRSREPGKSEMVRPPARSLRDLRDLTPARVGLGRSGASLPTEALLAFTLDHARARDAVHAAFDVAALREGLAGLGLATFEVHSRAGNR